jgi:hypothetical protein
MKKLKWTDPYLPLPPEVAECFEGLPSRIEVPQGTEIYRLRTNRQEAAGSNIWESPWWFPETTFKQIASRAARSGMGVTTSARSGLAVPPRFNPDFNNIVIVSLVRSGFAWAGKTASQKWSETFQVRLSGGFEQWWLPGLEQIDLRFKFFGWVD